MVRGEELVLEVVFHHLLHLLEVVLMSYRLLGEKHGEDQRSSLVSCVLVVAVAVEDDGGARGQLLEAVDDGHGLVPLEGASELVVDVELDLVAVLAGHAVPVDLEDGAVEDGAGEGGGEGGGQTLGQAVQRPFSPTACSQEQADRLVGMGRLEVLR